MSSLSIRQSPNFEFKIPFYGKVSVSISEAARSKMTPCQELTNTTALKIFTAIKQESDVIAFFLKPVGLLTLGALVAVTGFFIATLTVASVALSAIFAIVGIAMTGLGGGLIGFSLPTIFFNDEIFPEITRAYTEQSEIAVEYIQTIRAAQSRGEELCYILPPSTCPAGSSEMPKHKWHPEVSGFAV